MWRYWYGTPDYYGWHTGRHLHLHRYWQDIASPWHRGYGYGPGYRGIYDYSMVPSKAYLQDTLAWLKDEKAQIEKAITEIEDLLKSEQNK